MRYINLRLTYLLTYMKGDLSEALLLLDIVLLMSVVFIYRCLGFDVVTWL